MTPPLPPSTRPVFTDMTWPSREPAPSALARRLNAMESLRERREAEIQAMERNDSISAGEFLMEMVAGLPRGAVRMARDTRDNPVIVGGVVGTILGIAYLLPSPYAKVFSRGLMYLGTGVSGFFIAKGTVDGIGAWRRNDRAALRLASTDFGVGVLSMGLAYGGYRIATKLGSSPEIALRWGVLGNVLHSSDEIAATLALIRGASRVGQSSTAY